MAATLAEVLLAPDTQPHVVADCQQLIEQQVSGLSGVTGSAVKLAYKTVSNFAPGYLKARVEELVPELAGKLESFWADFTISGSGSFGDYLAKRGDEVSEALLAVTDEQAAHSGRPMIVKAYGSVRGGAAKHVTAALPSLGSLVQKYTG
jgi:hypothetical protein